MKLYFSDQQNHFREHLDFFKAKEVMPYIKALLTEKTTTIPIATSSPLKELDLSFFFN